MKNNQCCTGNCNQGRLCLSKKDASIDRATVVVATLLLICIVAMCFGFYRLINGNAGQECAIEVQFKDSKATYIGTTV
jgi:hypothetical protein